MAATRSRDWTSSSDSVHHAVADAARLADDCAWEPITILIVAADNAYAWDLGEQLDADGNTIYLANDRRAELWSAA